MRDEGVSAGLETGRAREPADDGTPAGDRRPGATPAAGDPPSAVPSQDCLLRTGRVAQAADDGGVLAVAVGRRAMPARRAASCLLEPQAGDTVLLALTGKGQATGTDGDKAAAQYVLAVLVRADPAATATIAAPGPATRIAAATIHLDAERAIRLHARTVALAGETVTAVCHRLVQTGRALLQCFAEARTAAERHDTHAGELTTRAQARTEHVAGIDHRTVGTRVETVADGAFQQSHTAVQVASEDVRIDAKRVSIS